MIATLLAKPWFHQAARRSASAECGCASVRWLLLCIVMVTTGCVHFGRRGPVAQDVIIARQLSQQGLDALHDGDFQLAEERFALAIEQCPANTDARYQLANCLWKRGATHEAIAQLEEALKMAGYDDVEMVVELGYMEANVDRLERANDLAEEAIRMAPNHAGAWRLHGDVRREVGHGEAALASYHRSLSYDPQNLEVQLASAELYAALGRPHRVLATLHRIEDKLSTEHRPESMLVLKSRALADLDRHDEAIQLLASSSEQRELSSDTLTFLAQLQAAAGQPVAAERTVQRALRRADAKQQLIASRTTPPPLR
jgi:tetratricopeptide (TPR) repeat protein